MEIVNMLWLLFLLVFVGCVEGECPGEDLNLAPRPYTKPENLSVCDFPYIGPNCTCPSPMFECACHKFGRCGVYPGCIPKLRVNNGLSECGDWSDEFSEGCQEDRFQCDCFNTTCKGYFGCILSYEQCDGLIDCLDGSDEAHCAAPVKMVKCNSYQTNNTSKNAWRVRIDEICDGKNDCGNWSDEVNCTCPANTYECPCYRTKNCTSGYGCIRNFAVCNGVNNCGDWSDEYSCSCPADRLECPCHRTKNCSWGYGCIHKHWLCNRIIDCGDWNDKVNCTCPAEKFECPCYKRKNCVFNSGCINKKFQCDGVNDCGDWSDEVNCTCPADKFECNCYKTKNCISRNGCLNKNFQCNGRIECGDWSDELNCSCPSSTFQCKCIGEQICVVMYGNCINPSLLCDGNRDCFDGSDETYETCNNTGLYARCPCSLNDTKCLSVGGFIDFDKLGDNVKDCSDGSDELCSVANFYCGYCTMFATICTSEQLARYLIHTPVPAKCNTVIQPSCAEDTNNCTAGKVICVSTACKAPESFCWDLLFCKNQQLVKNIDFCNFVPDCNDTSDEIREGFGFKCSGSSRQGVCVLPQANVFDSVAQCSDKSDLCFVNGQFRCFQCFDKKIIISSKQVCEGIVDCFDMSDECLCLNRNLCDKIMKKNSLSRKNCKNNSICAQQKEIIFNSSMMNVDKMNKEHGLFDNYLEKDQCVLDNRSSFGLDEIFKCARTDNKLLRTRFQNRLNHGEEVKSLLNSICDGKTSNSFKMLGELNCPIMYYCFSQQEINIKYTQVCDGKVDCDDSSDEFLNLCYKTRYYCKTNGQISIDRKTVCDGIIDCDNESDESRCRCKEERFFCTNKEPLSIEWKLVQNGIQDCSDGSDECVNLARDAFADVNEMIANPIYRAIFWITAFLAMGGNSFVFIATAQSLWKADRNQNVFINTNVFILNLSLSDFLMGVYLFAIIIQATQVSGSYCLHDKEWRSSSLCSGLGALAIVSSEASAFTMTAMTTFRLVSAFKPFLIRSVRVGRIALAELFCWILAVVLATVPLLQVTSEYFATDVWFPNNFFGTDFVSRENMSLLAERIVNANLASWNDVKLTINKAFPRNSIKGEFGYYGKTSVCMPRLFATTGEFVWEYSTFLITINFLMFIYMVIAYVLVYKQSNRMKGSRSNDISSKMQKRISRLILTDFCCWIPVCVMGYLSVGGIEMPLDAFVLSACLLLPINSALNPLLYSKVIEDQLTRAKKWLVKKLSSLRAFGNRSSDLAVRYNAHREEEAGRVIEIVETNN